MAIKRNYYLPIQIHCYTNYCYQIIIKLNYYYYYQLLSNYLLLYKAKIFMKTCLNIKSYLTLVTLKTIDSKSSMMVKIRKSLVK